MGLQEIKYRFGPIEHLWWRYMPGVEIEVPWPVGNIIVNDEDPRWVDLGGAVWVDLGTSADPNDHYRWWLEKNVGRQGWDWNWRIGRVSAETNVRDSLVIKFRRGREKWASLAALQWQ